jgi:hypothetical protein
VERVGRRAHRRHEILLGDWRSSRAAGRCLRLRVRQSDSRNPHSVQHVAGDQPARGPLHARQNSQQDRPGQRRLAVLLDASRINARTTDEYHYKGDWILRTHPESGKTEIVAQGPVPKACIPTSVLDPDRMFFTAGRRPATAPTRQSHSSRTISPDEKCCKPLSAARHDI